MEKDHLMTVSAGLATVQVRATRSGAVGITLCDGVGYAEEYFMSRSEAAALIAALNWAVSTVVE